MSSTSVLLVVTGYFVLLILVSFFTGRNSDNDTFFSGNRSSKWYVVAFGMIGASLSGVTFISVPGWVEAQGFSYMQMVLGYVLGYVVIIYFLLPLYYKHNLVSIYQYLEDRFGFWSYKTGAFFFLISRVIGASFRLFLVAEVFQISISDHFNIPYWATVLMTIGLIWVYTFRSGIKTIVWTDTLQTFFMLLAVGVAVVLIKGELGWSTTQMVSEIAQSDYSNIFFWDWKGGNFFVKQFLSGAFIAIVMTGLDQDMMQKNLTCPNLKDAQRNVWGLSISLVFVNLIFLSLGALLFMYAGQNGITIAKGDALFTTLALKHLSPVVGLFFVLGVIAAAYSSADSALTSLTTSFCIDFLGFRTDKNGPEADETESEKQDSKKARIIVHVAFSLLLFNVIMLFTLLDDTSVIGKLFKAASYTYGPLLGMFFFGIITNRNVRDGIWIPVICVLSPLICYWLNVYLMAKEFDLGYLILLINGVLTFGGMFIFSNASGKDPVLK